MINDEGVGLGWCEVGVMKNELVNFKELSHEGTLIKEQQNNLQKSFAVMRLQLVGLIL